MEKPVNPVGLKRGTVQLSPYNPAWHELFEAEKITLLNNVGDYIFDIEHIGSTSVPGLSAKPIIDMIASVENLSVYTQLIEPLTKLGYEFMPERVFDDRVFLPKGPRDNRTYHLSLVVKNSRGWKEPIAFREYLRSYPVEREKYQALKENLAQQYPNDRASYTKAKAYFIEQSLIA